MNKPIDPRDVRALERQQADLASRQKLLRDQQITDVQWLMANPAGRRIMARLLDMSGTARNSFTGSSTTFYNEGRRSVGVELEAEIRDHAFDNYIAMLQEQRA
jgi:hypothetical protein